MFALASSTLWIPSTISIQNAPARFSKKAMCKHAYKARANIKTQHFHMLSSVDETTAENTLSSALILEQGITVQNILLRFNSQSFPCVVIVGFGKR
jgi:hypothetical protein